MIDEPASVYAEAIRMLRSNLEVANLEVGARTIMVTSGGPREGKSTTVANLAVAFARSGKNVALVDLDLRQPIIAAFFDLPEGVGITDVVLAGVPVKQAITPISVSATPRPRARQAGSADQQSPRLSVLPVGHLSENPWEFASTDALKDVLTRLRTGYDLVLIDAPPMGVVGDARSIASSVDALLVIAREGTVELPDLENLARELDLVAAPRLGLVLTGAEVHEAYPRRTTKPSSVASTPEPTPVPPVRPLRARSAGRRRAWVVPTANEDPDPPLLE